MRATSTRSSSSSVGELVTGVRRALDVLDQGGPHLLASLRRRGGLVVGDGDEQPGHHHHERDQQPRRRELRRGAGSSARRAAGLCVGGVEGLGEDVVEQRGTHRPQAATPGRPGHGAVPEPARSARTIPTTWTT